MCTRPQGQIFPTVASITTKNVDTRSSRRIESEAMNTPVLSAIIVSVLATTLFVLALAIVCLVVVFVPTARLSALRQFFTHRTAREEQTPALTDVRVVPARAAADQRPDDDDGTSNGPAVALRRARRLGYFVIETEQVERTRLLVEMFLERETKRWRLDGSTGNLRAIGQIPKSAVLRSTLLYLVRFRRNSRPETLRDRLNAIGESSDFTVRLECGDDGLIARSA
jgi:hypothetical protein